jgi:hypothetical protein
VTHGTQGNAFRLFVIKDTSQQTGEEMPLPTGPLGSAPCLLLIRQARLAPLVEVEDTDRGSLALEGHGVTSTAFCWSKQTAGPG